MSRYDQIIHLPHPVSSKRAAMSLLDRAAQFSPFAALTGYEGVIAEAGRLTESFRDLDEGVISQINEQLRQIQSRIHTRPTVTVTWFQPDSRKAGGSFLTKTGPVKKLDPIGQTLLFTDGTLVDFACITALAILE